MTTNSVISWFGVFILFIGLLLSLIAGISYIRRASSPQWPNLTRWKKYFYPLVVLVGPALLTGVGCTLAGVYNNNQVTYDRWITGIKIGAALSGFLWIGIAVSYFIGIGTEHARARGWLPSWLLAIRMKK